jgi:hypothetical protein
MTELSNDKETATEPSPAQHRGSLLDRWMDDDTAKLRHHRYYTRTALGGRGWNDRLIAELLGDPDHTGPNPHFPDSGGHMRLWLIERVEKAEAEPAFVAYQGQRKRRQQGRKLKDEGTAP